VLFGSHTAELRTLPDTSVANAVPSERIEHKLYVSQLTAIVTPSGEKSGAPSVALICLIWLPSDCIRQMPEQTFESSLKLPLQNWSQLKAIVFLSGAHEGDCPAASDVSAEPVLLTATR
jgi:hypothetical protein